MTLIYKRSGLNFNRRLATGAHDAKYPFLWEGIILAIIPGIGEFGSHLQDMSGHGRRNQAIAAGIDKPQQLSNVVGRSLFFPATGGSDYGRYVITDNPTLQVGSGDFSFMTFLTVDSTMTITGVVLGNRGMTVQNLWQGVVSSGDGSLVFQIADTAGSFNSTIRGTTDLRDDKPHVVIGRRSTSNYQVFTDGVLEHSTGSGTTDPLSFVGNDFVLGNRLDDTDTNPFKGYQHAALVWDKKISNDCVDFLTHQPLAFLEPRTMTAFSIPFADTTPPFSDQHDPAQGAVDVRNNTTVGLHVKDLAPGVDQPTIAMTIEGSPVSIALSGTNDDVTVIHTPATPFSYNQIVNVTVDADDLDGNSMAQDVYSFLIAPPPTINLDASPMLNGSMVSQILVALLTLPGWPGNLLFRQEKHKIGSEFINKLNGPATLTGINDMRNAALAALPQETFGQVEVEVINPTGRAIEVNITVAPPDQETVDVRIFKDGSDWTLTIDNEIIGGS